MCFCTLTPPLIAWFPEKKSDYMNQPILKVMLDISGNSLIHLPLHVNPHKTCDFPQTGFNVFIIELYEKWIGRFPADPCCFPCFPIIMVR